MDKDQNLAKTALLRNLVKVRKKKPKKVRNWKKLMRLKEYQGISHQGKCQILSKNKQMNKIGLCKQEKML